MKIRVVEISRDVELHIPPNEPVLFVDTWGGGEVTVLDNELPNTILALFGVLYARDGKAANETLHKLIEVIENSDASFSVKGQVDATR